MLAQMLRQELLGGEQENLFLGDGFEGHSWIMPVGRRVSPVAWLPPDEPFGRRRGTVERPHHSAVMFGNERSVLDWSSYPDIAPAMLLVLGFSKLAKFRSRDSVRLLLEPRSEVKRAACTADP